MRRRAIAALTLTALSGAIVFACTDDTTLTPELWPEAGVSDAGPSDAASGDADASDASTKIPAPEAPLASNASIAALTINQAVEISLTDAIGAPSGHRSAPVIVGRPGVVRVYVTLANGVTSAALGGELWIATPGHAPRQFKDKKTIAGPSTAAALDSTLTFDLPADAIQRGSSYRVYLTSTGPAGVATDAQLPRDDSTVPFQALDTGVLKVRLVPLAYNGDGSGRVPDLSAAHVERMRVALFGMMPVSSVALDVHVPLPFAEMVTNGTFSRLLSFVTQLRLDEKAPPDLYYYGIVQPKEKEADFCMGGCTEGESFIPWTGTTAGEHAAVGTPYDFERDNRVFVHEMGHALGTSHAPCGSVLGADARFPYAGARIGSWGYDLATHTLLDPTMFFDIMSYCAPVWISDFNYASIGDHLAVSALLATYPGR